MEEIVVGFVIGVVLALYGLLGGWFLRGFYDRQRRGK